MYTFFFPYWWIILPAILLGFIAQMMVRNAFQRYSRVRTGNGMTGADAARQILDNNGLRDVPIERVRGNLTDHYDPRSRILRLSQAVYSQPSVAAVGIAAHEAGHAIQHANSYAPLAIRNTVYPVASFGSKLGPIVVLVGFLFSMGQTLITIGIVLFSAAVAFTILTLPVEFNASRRALALIRSNSYLSRQEVEGARSVLRAAALTYVASALASVLTLLRLILLSRSR
jgi:hypothetical protein